MPIIRHVAVVFRIAAGPRLGFGHLIRCRAIARALGVMPRVSIRGTAATRRAGAALGLRVIDGGPGLLDREMPQILVVDDPSAPAARPWVSAARRRGIPVATIHDGGLARVDADLVIDGITGIGGRPGLGAEAAGCVAAIPPSAYVLAVDLPSGAVPRCR